MPLSERIAKYTCLTALTLLGVLNLIEAADLIDGNYNFTSSLLDVTLSNPTNNIEFSEQLGLHTVGGALMVFFGIRGFVK
jgi:hypothetical protein